MFSAAEVLPLFTGTAPAGHVGGFAPRPAARQMSLSCPICKGAGEVVVDARRVRCTCRWGVQHG
jgi:hypothetical protein